MSQTGPVTETPDLKERIAIALWHRFAPDHHMEWSEESHAAEYRDAAEAVMILGRRSFGVAQCSQDRNETLRGLAAFFSESVHHVWDKDEIADCLTNMISADSSIERGGK